MFQGLTSNNLVVTMAHILSSVGAFARAFSYLAIPTMRKALKKTVNIICSSK